jgi:O-antigen/teichoic acid export membrane protein
MGEMNLGDLQEPPADAQNEPFGSKESGLADSVTVRQSTGKTRASVLLAGTKIFAFVLQMLSIRLYLHWVGEHQYGLYLGVQAWCALLVFLDPNITIGAQKRLTEAWARKDESAISRIVNLQIFGNLIVGVVSALVLIVFGPRLAIALGARPEDLPPIRLIIFGVGVYLGTYLLAAYSAMFAATERFKFFALANSAQSLLGTFVSIGLLYVFRTVDALAAGLAIGYLVPVVIVAIMCSRAYVKRGRTHWDRDTAEDVTRLGMRSYFNRIASVLASRSDRLVFGTHASALTSYAVACRLPEVLCDTLSSLSVTSLPELTRAHADDPKLFSELIDRNSKLQLAIGCSFILIPTAFGHSILKLWLGNHLTDTAYVVLLIGVYRTFELLYIGYTSAFYAMGKPQKMFKFAVFNAIVTATMSYPSYRFGGLIGLGVMNASIDVIQFVPISLTLLRNAAVHIHAKQYFAHCFTILGLSAAVAIACRLLLDQKLLMGREILVVLVVPIISLAWIAFLCRSGLCPTPDPVKRLVLKFKRA